MMMMMTMMIYPCEMHIASLCPTRFLWLVYSVCIQTWDIKVYHGSRERGKNSLGCSTPLEHLG